MSVAENNITKLCSFYISDWHLVTMLLPYINKKINEQTKIATILEKDIKQNITTLVEKLNLKNKEKVLELNWGKTEQRKNVFSNMNENKEVVVIVNGEKEFIERKNKKIQQYLSTHKINAKIKIINCYEIVDFNGSINEILQEHDKILNTSGEKEISEIFEDYKKNTCDISKKAVVGLE